MTGAEALDALAGHRYLALDVELEPVGSPTIQPTSFANTGPSFYEAPEGGLAVVVDSVASMANMLELTLWDETACMPRDAVAALPWVRVSDSNGAYYTSSRRASHRLNAASIMTGAVVPEGELFGDRLIRLLADQTPPVMRTLARVVWDHDPLALLHGCWFPGIWDGRARVTRALSARIDALEVQSQSAQVGGQKTRDGLDEPGGVEDTGYRTVRGEAPYYASEISAARIVAPFVLDLGLLRSYGLEPEKYQALVAAAVLMVAELVNDWPRRRSRCTLAPKNGAVVRRPQGWILPPVEELRSECKWQCEAAAGTEAATPVEVTYAPKPAKSKRANVDTAEQMGADSGAG